MWQINEKSFLSLKELNTFIAENQIKPEHLIQYKTLPEQIKQCTKYILTYWINTRTKGED